LAKFFDRVELPDYGGHAFGMLLGAGRQLPELVEQSLEGWAKLLPAGRSGRFAMDRLRRPAGQERRATAWRVVDGV
jgi:hypothetical protein